MGCIHETRADDFSFSSVLLTIASVLAYTVSSPVFSFLPSLYAETKPLAGMVLDLIFLVRCQRHLFRDHTIMTRVLNHISICIYAQPNPSLMNPLSIHVTSSLPSSAVPSIASVPSHPAGHVPVSSHPGPDNPRPIRASEA